MLWAVARQVTLSVEFSRQEYCSGLPFPSLRDLLDPVIEPRSPVQSQGDSLPSEPPEKPNFLLLSCIYQDGILHWSYQLHSPIWSTFLLRCWIYPSMRSRSGHSWNVVALRMHFQIILLSFLIFYCFKSKALFVSMTEREEKNGNNDLRCGRSFPCPCHLAGMNRSMQV